MTKRKAGGVDEQRIVEVSGELCEIIEAAAIGNASWDLVPAAIVDAFPGTMASLHSLSGSQDRLNFFLARNIEPKFLETYASYYAFRNPWASHWGGKENGAVMISEEDFPSRLLAHTEFYNDWLKPQPNLAAAVGLKIHGDADSLVHLPIHYPLSLAPRYDRPLARFLGRISGSFARAQEISRHFIASVESAIASAAIVDRFDCAAFVIDGHMRLRAANRQAETLFAAGDIVGARQGVVSLALPGKEAAFSQTVSHLVQRHPTEDRRLALHGPSGTWLLAYAALPAGAAESGRLLMQPQMLVLVLVRKIKAAACGLDLAALADLYRLTRSELAFCQRLASGESLIMVARALGLSRETARSRCKTIFQKTGTHRQAELVALLKSVF